MGVALLFQVLDGSPLERGAIEGESPVLLILVAVSSYVHLSSAAWECSMKRLREVGHS